MISAYDFTTNPHTIPDLEGEDLGDRHAALDYEAKVEAAAAWEADRLAFLALSADEQRALRDEEAARDKAVREHIAYCTANGLPPF